MNSGAVAVRKVGTEENLADALTKGVGSYAFAKHTEGVGMELRKDRRSMAPALEESASAEVKGEGERGIALNSLGQAS